MTKTNALKNLENLRIYLQIFMVLSRRKQISLIISAYTLSHLSDKQSFAKLMQLHSKYANTLKVTRERSVLRLGSTTYRPAGH